MANKEVRCDDDETKHSQLHAVLENAREIVVSVYDDTSGRAILFQQISYIVLSIMSRDKTSFVTALARLQINLNDRLI